MNDTDAREGDDAGVDRRQCEIGIGHLGDVADDELAMDSGMCAADAVGVFEVENPHPDGSNHIKALCETHRDLLDEGPGMIVGRVELPSEDGGEANDE